VEEKEYEVGQLNVAARIMRLRRSAVRGDCKQERQHRVRKRTSSPQQRHLLRGHSRAMTMPERLYVSARIQNATTASEPSAVRM